MDKFHIELYEDAMDCNVAANDTWQSVIAEYFAREREMAE